MSDFLTVHTQQKLYLAAMIRAFVLSIHLRADLFETFKTNNIYISSFPLLKKICLGVEPPGKVIVNNLQNHCFICLLQVHLRFLAPNSVLSTI